MKLTAIIGSPRKNGNCRKMAELIGERLGGEEKIDIDFIFTGDLDLGFCRGCCACFRKGEEFCPKKEKVADAIRRMEQSDAVLFASPVYAHQVSATMKNFVDHLAFLFHRPQLAGKPALLLVTTDGSGIKETMRYLRLVAVGWGMYVSGEIGTINMAHELSRSYREKTLCLIDAAGGRVRRVIETGQRPSPSLYELVFFRAMRAKAGLFPVDKAFWESRGWWTGKYYLDLPCNPLALLVANALEGLSRMLFESMYKRMQREAEQEGLVKTGAGA